MNTAFYEVELAEAEIERNEPVIARLFILRYANLRMLELYYNFFTKCSQVNEVEELEKHTDSLYLPFPEKEPEDCIQPAEWERLRSKDCTYSFTTDAVGIFFPGDAVTSTKNTTR